MPPNRQDPVRAPASVGDTACSGDRYRGYGVEHGYQGRSADLATDVPTCLPAMRDDDVDTRVHGAQPSATEPTVRASVVDHSDTRGGISPERGDAWAPEARQAARRSCRGQARWRLTANGPATSDAVFTGADVLIIKTPGTSVAGQRHRNVSGLVSAGSYTHG